MSLPCLPAATAEEVLAALRERAAPAIRRIRDNRRMALEWRSTLLLFLCFVSGVLFTALALLLHPLFAAGWSLTVAAFILAGRFDRAAGRIRTSAGLLSPAGEATALLRAGQGLLNPPGQEDLVLLQTPTGDAWAVVGTGHQRLAQAEALAAADGGLWSAHLADMAVQAETPGATWPAALLRHDGHLVLLLGPDARPAALRPIS